MSRLKNRTLLFLCSALWAIGTSGCVTLTPHRLSFDVPPGAHVAMLSTTYDKLAEGDAPSGHIDFDLMADDSIHRAVLVHVSSPGYETTEEMIPLSKPGPHKIALEKNREVQRAESAAKEAREFSENRLKHLEDHPELPNAIRAAILSGRLLAGMTPADVRASIGNIYFTGRSEGVNGTIESWQARTDHYLFELYFVDGLLVRWDTRPAY